MCLLLYLVPPSTAKIIAISWWAPYESSDYSFFPWWVYFLHVTNKNLSAFADELVDIIIAVEW